jgi:hypothetical protein
MRRVTALLLALLAIGLYVRTAEADRVTPSDRVETRLRIRHDPDGQSVVIGHLLPGESLPLLASIPNWFKVAMPDGQSGFVSKAFSTQVIGQPIATSAAGEIRLGSWNIKKLGHGASKNFAVVAQIIESRYDVIAVVEVMQKGGGHPGYDSLISQLGNGWAGVVTADPRPDSSSGSAEFYAILFRPARVRLCNGWTGLVYHDDNSGGPGGAGADRFSREPAFACFATTRADGSAGFDFVLAGYHAIFAEGDINDIQNEVRHLDEVFASMSAAQPGERDLIISGDFNLVPSDLAAAITQQVHTIGTGSTLNGSGALTANLYDHMVAFDLGATAEMVTPGEVIDVRNLVASNKVFFDTVSDHLPLVARFRIDADDD